MTKDRATALDFARDLDFSEILTNPILDIAARFWDSDRYEAFRIAYRSMRRIDDLVDDRKVTGGEIGPEEALALRQAMQAWLRDVKAELGRSGAGPDDPAGDQFTRQFAATLKRFAIPLWPWERLCGAMTYDLSNWGFSNLRAFLRYTEGAAIAPAAVFVHLCGISRHQSVFVPPPYDIRAAARPLAVFSYLVHIMRDFQKDQLAGLNYFADELLARHHLTFEDTRLMAELGEVDHRLRGLMTDYHRIGQYYRRKARRVVDQTLPHMAPRYQLSMEIIYGLYSQIFDHIDVVGGHFTSPEMNPEPSQVQAAIDDIIRSFVPVNG